MSVASTPAAPPRGSLIKRLVLGAGVTIAALNIWTGAPLLALFCSMLVWALGRLSAAYDRARGAKPPPRQQAPWMRSMRGERAKDLKRDRPASPTEKIMIAVVVLAVVSFEVWFFFFATSPLPQS